MLWKELLILFFPLMQCACTAHSYDCSNALKDISIFKQGLRKTRARIRIMGGRQLVYTNIRKMEQMYKDGSTLTKIQMYLEMLKKTKHYKWYGGRKTHAMIVKDRQHVSNVKNALFCQTLRKRDYRIRMIPFIERIGRRNEGVELRKLNFVLSRIYRNLIRLLD